jgi:formiminoglutamase
VNAREWLGNSTEAGAAVVIVGAPISKASISPSQAWSTPPAVRQALARFPTWDAEHEIDLEALRVLDLGDVEGDRNDPDAGAAHQRIQETVQRAASMGDVVVVIGGDNSLTRPAAQGLAAGRSGQGWGLLTLDAHHDCRPLDNGPRNGTPVRELIQGGLPGDRVAQIGINPLGNERAHAEWAAAQGVHVSPLEEIRRVGIDTAVTTAAATLVRGGAEWLYVDLDVDVLDRAFAPACPASMPGGLQPVDVLRAVYALGRNPRVLGFDITEVDAAADVSETTVRLAAAALLTFCSGVASRAAVRRAG